MAKPYDNLMGGSALWHCMQGKVLGQGLVRLMCKIGWSHIGAEEDGSATLCLAYVQSSC